MVSWGQSRTPGQRSGETRGRLGDEMGDSVADCGTETSRRKMASA